MNTLIKFSLIAFLMVFSAVITPVFASLENDPPNGIYWSNTHTVIQHSPVIPAKAQAWHIRRERHEDFRFRRHQQMRHERHENNHHAVMMHHFNRHRY